MPGASSRMQTSLNSMCILWAYIDASEKIPTTWEKDPEMVKMGWWKNRSFPLNKTE